MPEEPEGELHLKLIQVGLSYQTLFFFTYLEMAKPNSKKRKNNALTQKKSLSHNAKNLDLNKIRISVAAL